MVSMMPVWCQKSSLMKLKWKYDKDPVNPHMMVISGQFGPFLPKEQQDRHGNGQQHQRHAVADGVYQLDRGEEGPLRLEARQK